MKYITEDRWNKLKSTDFRIRFYVDSYLERLSVETPHFFQARLMNTFSCCEEILTYIDEYFVNERNLSYLSSAAEELTDCLSTDDIARKMFIEAMDTIESLLKSIKNSDVSNSKLSKLKVICQNILGKEQIYGETIFNSLKSVIFDGRNIAHVGRLTDEISALTGSFVTHLLKMGYSPTYLYNRIDLITREKNFAERSFEEQFVHVFGRLQNQQKPHEVTYALHAHRPKNFLGITDDPVFKFLNEPPPNIQGSNLEKLKKDFIPNVIATCEVEATDYVTAAMRAKESLDKTIDATIALESNARIKVSPYCVIISKNGKLVHAKTLNTSLLLEFLSSEGGTYLSGSDANIRSSFQKLNKTGKEQLQRSLRYLRLARESASMEQKILNLWIALESLFSDRDSSILARIMEYIPQIYAVTAISRRVNYMKDLLNKNYGPPLAENSTENTSRSDLKRASYTNSEMYEILANEASAKSLFEAIQYPEHLKFRIIKTHAELKSSNDISKRLKRSESDVSRQLRRIYFIRNKIAHTGHFSNVRPQLVIHLLDYLAVAYFAITEAAARSTEVGRHDIIDLLAAYKVGTEIVANRCNDKESDISKLSLLTPAPII